MRIAEIEKLLIAGDCSEELFEQYKVALKRVPKNLRCQHCRATAAAMPLHCSVFAIALISYGLEFCESWVDNMCAYYHMAVIYERNKNFDRALVCYKNALDAVPDPKEAYAFEYAAHMLRVEMHIHQFTYTDDLRAYYEKSIQMDKFSQSFLKKQFYKKLAEIVVFSHEGRRKEARSAIEEAAAMLSPTYKGPLTELLKRKKVNETVGATEEAIAFLKKMKGGAL